MGAGRGVLFITAAKLWFMVAGYAVQFLLPRALQPELFGVWTLVLALVSPINNVMVTATIQGVSRFASESEAHASSVTRAALRMQLYVGGGTAVAFFLLSPVFAWFEHDAALTPYLRLGAGVVLCYAFYAVFVGAANGARAFHKQAGLDVTFATLRATLVCGAAALTHSAMASVGGFVVAAAIILVISFFLVGLGPRPAERFPIARLYTFFVGVAIYLLITNLLMFVDGLLLKRLVAEAAARAGAADPAAVANLQEGYYGAVQAIGRIPYQLILSVTFVIFPLVSRASFDADQGRTRRYIEATMQYSLLAVALFATCLGARPLQVMRLLYKPEYAVGAPALAVLLFAYLCFSLFSIAGTIINASGRTRPTTVLGSLTLALCIALCWAGTAHALSSGGDPLLYAALGTAMAMAVGLCATGVYLHRAFGGFIRLSSIARTGVASAVTVAVGRLWPTTGFLGGKLGTLVSLAALGLVFLAAVIGSGELRPRELLAQRRR
jgi:stage V sporulation protein B